MAEKPEELDIREIKLLKFNSVTQGFVKFDKEEIEFFEKETWKLFVTRIGAKILDENKDKIYGECLINFFHADKESMIKSQNKTNKTLGIKSLLEPIFSIKYDKELYIEFINRNEKESVPKKVFFIVLCM